MTPSERLEQWASQLEHAAEIFGPCELYDIWKERAEDIRQVAQDSRALADWKAERYE